NPAVPIELDSLMGRALARDRHKRYPKASDLARDLDRFTTPTTKAEVAALVSRWAERPSGLRPAVRRLSPDEAATTSRSGPIRETHGRSSSKMPQSRRGGMAISTKLGIGLGVILAASAALVTVRFILPGPDAPRPPDASVL